MTRSKFIDLLVNQVRLLEHYGGYRWRKGLPPDLYEKPYSLKSVDLEHINYKIIEADHKRLVYDMSIPTLDMWVTFALCVFGLLVVLGLPVFLIQDIWGAFDFSIWDSIYRNSRDHVWLDPSMTILVAFSVWMMAPQVIIGLVYPFTRQKPRLLIFDREHGTVSLPPRFWGENEVVPWNDLRIYLGRERGATMGMMRYYAMRPKDRLAVKITNWIDPNREIAMLHQYMMRDKYPLPEGDVFDAYRYEDDQERYQRTQIVLGI